MGTTIMAICRVAILLLFVLATFAEAKLRAEDPANVEVDSSVRLDVETVSLNHLGVTTNEWPQAVSSHPLLPTLRIAREGYLRIVRDVRDYTCVMIKRERVNGRLRGPEQLFAKVRHERFEDEKLLSPFSVYMRFTGPESVRNREVLFVKASGRDKVLVKNGGKRLSFLTVALNPIGPIAMTGNRYPVTEFGIKRLIERMIILGEQELAHDECEVEIRDDVDFDERVCQCIEVRHPIQRPHFAYHLVRIYIDNELRVPVRFESYGWPEAGSEVPRLLEEYTYRDIKLNVGLGDADFQRDNPAYGFR